MNYICSIFLTLFVVFRPLVPLVEYAVQYDYISEVLCVNKDNAELHCNGKCYLRKQLSKANDTDSFPSNKTKSSGQKLLDIYILPDIAGISTSENTFFSHVNFLFRSEYSFLFLKSVFRPPVLS